jgi:hypothetical protein
MAFSQLEQRKWRCVPRGVLFGGNNNQRNKNNEPAKTLG